MKQTTAWQIPYPESPDHTRTWEYWQSIAERVDTCLTNLLNQTKAGVPAIKTGAQSVTISGTGGTIAAITFATPFTATPVVFVASNTNAGNLNQWVFRAIGISTTGFSINAGGPAGPTSSSIIWLAVLPATTPFALADLAALADPGSS